MKRNYCIGLVFSGASLLLVTPLFASTPYCDINPSNGLASLTYASPQTSALNTRKGETVTVSRSEAAIFWQIERDVGRPFTLGLEAQYSILNFDSVSPMTNGHLHRWGLSFSGVDQYNDANILYEVTPAISVSSNALKNPELINGESLQLNTALIYNKKLNRQLAWVVGFRSDYRFGGYSLYPVGGVCWQPSQEWLLQLVWPDFRVRKAISRSLQLSLFTHPDGNRWHVFSEDLQRDSLLTYRSVVMGISLEWLMTPLVEWSLAVERQGETDYNLVLDDDRWLQTGAASTTTWQLRGKIEF